MYHRWDLSSWYLHGQDSIFLIFGIQVFHYLPGRPSLDYLDLPWRSITSGSCCKTWEWPPTSRTPVVNVTGQRLPTVQPMPMDGQIVRGGIKWRMLEKRLLSEDCDYNEISVFSRLCQSYRRACFPGCQDEVCYFRFLCPRSVLYAVRHHTGDPGCLRWCGHVQWKNLCGNWEVLLEWQTAQLWLRNHQTCVNDGSG